MTVTWPYLPALIASQRRILAALSAAPVIFASTRALGQGPAPDSVQASPDGRDPAPVSAPPAAAPPPAAPEPAAPAAEPAPLAESPLVPPKIDLTVPEPSPSVVRKHHNHDGFYLRASVGFAWSRAEVASDAENQPSYTVNGGGISLDLLVGATPTPSLAIGGGAMLKSISDPEVHLSNGSDAGSGSGGVLFVGPFVDGFPMSNGGLHLGALAGFAGGTARRQGGDDDFGGAGVGVAAWVGQGFWVGSEVSLGFLLKLDAAFMSDGSGSADLSNTLYGGSLMVSVLYH